MPRPTEAIDVREAVAADAPAFATFIHRAWREAGPSAPGFAGATDESIAEIASPAAFGRSIGGPERRMFLAWEGDAVVGFASLRRADATTCELSGVVVLAGHAGQGIGSALVGAALDAAVTDTYSRIVVKTETTNHLARSFYERHGFQVERTETEAVDTDAVRVWRLSRRL